MEAGRSGAEQGGSRTEQGGAERRYFSYVRGMLPMTRQYAVGLSVSCDGNGRSSKSEENVNCM